MSLLINNHLSTNDYNNKVVKVGNVSWCKMVKVGNWQRKRDWKFWDSLSNYNSLYILLIVNINTLTALKNSWFANHHDVLFRIHIFPVIIHGTCQGFPNKTRSYTREDHGWKWCFTIISSGWCGVVWWWKSGWNQLDASAYFM